MHKHFKLFIETICSRSRIEVETADTKQKFEQVFSENMGAKSKPKASGLF